MTGVVEVSERLERLRRRAELEQRLLSSQGIPIEPPPGDRLRDGTGSGGKPSPAVLDVVEALQPVLARHPGLSVAVWPPGDPATDPHAAVLLTFDDDGLRVLMPRSRSGDGPAGGRSAAAELASLLRDPDGNRPTGGGPAGG